MKRGFLLLCLSVTCNAIPHTGPGDSTTYCLDGRQGIVCAWWNRGPHVAGERTP